MVGTKAGSSILVYLVAISVPVKITIEVAPLADILPLPPPNLNLRRVFN